MTDDQHIDAIGRAMRRVEKAQKHLHAVLERAQNAYIAKRRAEGGMVQPFTGGIDKPDPNDQ